MIQFVRRFEVPGFAGIRLRRAVVAFVVTLTASAALASVPCSMLLAGYLEQTEGVVEPCLVDLQESGLCFGLPGTGLSMAVRTLDGYLQTLGMPRPYWEAGLLAEATRFDGPSGDRLEIVLSGLGPFDTLGACRIVPER